MLWTASIEGGTLSNLERRLWRNKDLIDMAIDTDGNKVLHVVVGRGNNYFVKRILSFIVDKDLPTMTNGSRGTALHIAASVGNTKAACLLIKKNRGLLEIRDTEG
ncbi:hypothetical protein L2E82_38979 [Cichorium intybus]|uniref:Uncharacterized protein n=1 Tax=Cichorium intybus TaxID=13427 RepID=A0ACB9AGY3_CICIN|nr:hypothetical protein L2E82_38979 [Cichorium intybus]